jgi:hypothetical protein
MVVSPDQSQVVSGGVSSKRASTARFRDLQRTLRQGSSAAELMLATLRWFQNDQPIAAVPIYPFILVARSDCADRSLPVMEAGRLLISLIKIARPWLQHVSAEPRRRRVRCDLLKCVKLIVIK